MQRSTKSSKFAPTFDSLEDRWCPAVAFSLDSTGTILTLTGDAKPNTVVIKQNDVINDLEVFGDGVTKHYASSKIQKIIVNLKDGNDSLTYQLGGGSNFVNGKTVLADLGLGNDSATYNFADNGLGGLATVLGKLNVQTQMRDGMDSVAIKLAQVTSTSAVFTSDLGAGDDKFQAMQLGDLTGKALVHIGVEGGKGKDFMDWNAMQDVDVSQGSILDVKLNGGADDDITTAHYEGRLDGHLRFRADGGAGKDTDRIGMTIDEGSFGYYDAIAKGGDDNDVIHFDLANHAPATLHLVQALVDGGLGMDIAGVTGPVAVINVP